MPWAGGRLLSPGPSTSFPRVAPPAVLPSGTGYTGDRGASLAPAPHLCSPFPCGAFLPPWVLLFAQELCPKGLGQAPPVCRETRTSRLF